MRRLAVLALVFVAAGCGSSGGDEQTTSTSAARPAPTSAYPGTTLYESGAWAVVSHGGEAAALHFVDGKWEPDRSGKVKVEFLGPDSPAPRLPQVAAELRASSKLAESALWVDGVELLEKGGGLTPTRGTIYGAPSEPLARGRHVAIAYARTAVAATAVARVFVVR